MSDSQEPDHAALGEVLWDISPDMLAVASMSGYLTAVNPSWQRVLGYSPQELTSQPYLDFVHPDDVAGTVAEARALLNPEHVTVNFENRYRDRNGIYHWLNWTTRPAPDSTYLCCVARDVTVEVMARREAARSAERFVAMFDDHLAVMLLIDPETGQIVDANRAAARFYGYTRDELRSMVITDINQLPPVDVTRWGHQAEAAERNYFIVPHRLANGQIRTVEVRTSPMQDQGRSLLFSIIHDVTAREDDQAKLRQAAAVFDNTGEAIIVTDSEGIVLQVNRAFTTITGWRAEDVLGHRAQTLGSDVWASEDIDLLRSTVLAGKEFRGQVPIGHADGTTSPVLATISPIRGPMEQITGYVAVIADVREWVQAEQALADSERRYRLLAENASDVVFLGDQQMNIHWVSDSVTATLGWRPDQLVGHPASEFVHPDDLSDLAVAVAGSTSGERVSIQYRWRCADGSWRWVAGFGRLVTDENGEVLGRVAGLRDIHDQVLAQAALADSEQRYRMLAEHATDVVWQLDLDGVLCWVSPSVAEELGWNPEELVGSNVRELIHPDDLASTEVWRAGVSSGARVPNLESRRLASDGTYRWMSLRGHVLTGSDGELTGLIVGMRDIEDEVLARTALAHAVEHDPLTGLASLPVAVARIERLLAGLPGRPPRAVGVLCIGVDWLKSVNEALTHAAGDRVIVEMATRIGTVVDDPDLVARGSGDEFLVLLPDLVSGADAGVLAEQIRQAARGTVTIGGNSFEPTVSIGIASGGRGAHAEELLRDASLAMHQAKTNGRDRCEFFQAQLAHEAQQRLSVEAGIREGLRAGQFVPWFQPVVDLRDGTVVGYEALVRWVRPDGQIVPPADFLPVAERTTLMADLDVAVMHQSVEMLGRLPAPLHVAVNVSAATLAQIDYAQVVAEALADSAVDPARLHVEFTETALLHVSDRVREMMRTLTELGVCWYVDDFGTGYSSISHLRDLPVAGLKLDLSFTAGIREGEGTSERLAQALVGLASGLGLDTVAEGVETPREAAVLRAQGWKHAQGWLYGRAEPADAILQA